MERLKNLKFNREGLVPAVIQDYYTGQVLMLAYMNEQSLNKTLKTGLTWFYSRSRKQLWQKGETSGNIQKVKSIAFDCDADTLLIKVEQKGVACHTGKKTCFNDFVKGEAEAPDNIFDILYDLLQRRKKELPEDSYSAKLFREGLEKINAKIQEESGEVIEASYEEDTEHLIYEIGDLIYHILVLMAEKDISWSEVKEELLRRRR